MIPLTNNSSTTTQKLVITLGGAATTTYPTCTVSSYVVPRQTKVVTGANGSVAGDTSEYQSGNEFTLLTAATETTIAAAPPQGSVKDIHHIAIPNPDTAQITVTVDIDDNGTNRRQIKATLDVDDTLLYDGKTGGRGWYCINSSGAEKVAISQIPMAPLFLAYNSADDTNQTGNGAVATVEFDTEVFDVTSNFASNKFTAPITGKYLLSFGLQVSAIPAGCTLGTGQLLTSNRTYNQSETFTAGTWTVKDFTLSVIADMDAADTATVRCQFSGGAGDTATIEGSSTLTTFFSGVRVG